MSRFRHRTPSSDALYCMQLHRLWFEALEERLNEQKMDPRYRALALTKLEEAAMYINKGLTHVDDSDTQVSENPPAWAQ